MVLNWTLKPFAELTPLELYAILRLRNEVFVVEQQCVFQDADNKDPRCHHLMGWEADELMAYTRIVPPFVSYTEPAIGRVVTSPKARGTGLGRLLMERSVEALYGLYGEVPIRIGAQVHLEKFYRSIGFTPDGHEYDEDGIAHIEMVRPSLRFS